VGGIALISSEAAPRPCRAWQTRAVGGVKLFVSFGRPDSPHISGQCNNPERVALITRCKRSRGCPIARHDVQSDISWACTPRMRREHRGNHPERDCHTPCRAAQQACSEKDYERDLRALVVRQRLGTQMPPLGIRSGRPAWGREKGTVLGAAHRIRCGTSHFSPVVSRASGPSSFRPTALPAERTCGVGHMIAELTGIGCSGEVAGKESDSDRDPATKLPRSRGYIYELLV